MKKQHILITGGTGKIGGQLVNHFVQEGWKVSYTSRSTDSRERLAERFRWNGDPGSALIDIVVDFSNKNAVENLLGKVRAESVNVLVNNARDVNTLTVNPDGLSSRNKMQDEYLMDVIIPYELATGLLSASESLKTIINVSSIYGVVPFNPVLYNNYPFSAPIQYSLAKAAVIHLTKELSIRYRNRCQVNTVTYGGVEGRVAQDFEARYSQLCPQQTMLTEEQTVGPVAFLASGQAKGITGQNLIQDGGWTVW